MSATELKATEQEFYLGIHPSGFLFYHCKFRNFENVFLPTFLNFFDLENFTIIESGTSVQKGNLTL